MLAVLSFAVYLGKTVLPMALRPSYDYPGVNPWHLAGASLLAASYFAGAVFLSRRRDKIPALAMIWVPATLLPVLHLIPLRPFVAERLLYFALIGVGVGVGWLHKRFPP